MPYDPDTGAWKYEDDSVEGRVTGMVDVNSPLIQQARTQGIQSANRRGLINSSIAAGASQDAAYKAAVPIATADANITNSKNLSAQGAEQNLVQGAQTIQGQKDVQAQSDAAANARLVQQLGSQERVAEAERAAAKERLGLQLSSEEQRAADSLKSAQLIAKGQNETSIANNTATNLTSVNNTQNTINANKDINQATINAQTAQWVTTATNTARNNHNSVINTINNNPNIGAADRARMIEEENRNFEADMATIAGVSNVRVVYTPPVVETSSRDAATPGGAPASPQGGTPAGPQNPSGGTPATPALTQEQIDAITRAAQGGIVS